jgi:hypothetical protein
VVSFNTPELCNPTHTGVSQFSLAHTQCGDKSCHVCIETTYQQQAVSYSVTADERCVCREPVALLLEPGETHMDTRSDASSPTVTSLIDGAAIGGGSNGGGATADAEPYDAGAQPQPVVAADGCESLLNLTQGAAADFCAGKKGCHVCVERIGFDNEPRRYMAHLCGCPGPYRLE